MKKSLIALAVAGAFAAPAFAATSNVDIYGQVRASVDYVNVKTGADMWKFNDQTSRIGFKGAEDLGGGLKAVWQWESALNNVDTGGATNVAAGSQRNTFIGLAGGFGTLILGTHDTPYKLAGSADVFADTSADSQKNTTGVISRGGWDNRASGTIAYVSPTVSGFHAAIAIVPGEGAAANGLMDAYSLALVYDNGPLKATFGYENWDKALIPGATKDKDAAKFNIKYSFGDFGVGYTYEKADVRGAATTTDKAHLLSGTYAMGPITLAAQYGKYDTAGTAGDLKRTTVGAIYGLSKRTNVYAAYDWDNMGNGGIDAQIFTMGMNTSF